MSSDFPFAFATPWWRLLSCTYKKCLTCRQNCIYWSFKGWLLIYSCVACKELWLKFLDSVWHFKYSFLRPRRAKVSGEKAFFADIIVTGAQQVSCPQSADTMSSNISNLPTFYFFLCLKNAISSDLTFFFGLKAFDIWPLPVSSLIHRVICSLTVGNTWQTLARLLTIERQVKNELQMRSETRVRRKKCVQRTKEEMEGRRGNILTEVLSALSLPPPSTASPSGLDRTLISSLFFPLPTTLHL